MFAVYIPIGYCYRNKYANEFPPNRGLECVFFIVVVDNNIIHFLHANQSIVFYDIPSSGDCDIRNV